MGPPSDSGGSPAPIDRPILEFLQTHLQTANQVAQATITDAGGHLKLRVTFESVYYPASADRVTLAVRWYTNDDFKIHYRETYPDSTWECRWDRHPNPHNTREHFHSPPSACTPGTDASWPADHRDMLTLVLDAVEERIADVWDSADS